MCVTNVTSEPMTGSQSPPYGADTQTRQANTAECDDRHEWEVAGTQHMMKDNRTGSNTVESVKCC